MCACACVEVVVNVPCIRQGVCVCVCVQSNFREQKVIFCFWSCHKYESVVNVAHMTSPPGVVQGDDSKKERMVLSCFTYL